MLGDEASVATTRSGDGATAVSSVSGSVKQYLITMSYLEVYNNVGAWTAVIGWCESDNTSGIALRACRC